MKISKLLLPMTLLAVALAACTQEVPVTVDTEGNEPVELKLAPITTRGPQNGEDPKEYTIKELRVMVFNKNGGTLVYNEFTENLEAPQANPVKLEMNTGTYDFAFIANEGMSTSAGSMHTILGGYASPKTLADLDDEAFGSMAFMKGENIPMTRLVTDVTVSKNANGDCMIQVGSATAINTTAWEVELVRLGIKLDLTLNAPHGLGGNNGSNFNRIEFGNVPDKVYLFPNRYGTTAPIYYPAKNAGAGVGYEAANAHKVTVSDWEAEFEEDYAFSETESGVTPYMMTWKFKGIILPESVFEEDPWTGSESEKAMAAAANAARAVTVLAYLNDRTVPLRGTIGIKEAEGQFTAPRNSHFTLNGTLTDHINFTVSVSEWDADNVHIYYPLPDPLDGGLAVKDDSRRANSILVKPRSKAFSIPVRWADDPAILAALGNVAPRIGAETKLEAELLWTDTRGATSGLGLASDAPLMEVDMSDRGESAYIVVTPGLTGAQGNAVIALRDFETREILWSWHIWVTDYAPGDGSAAWISGGKHTVSGGDVYRYTANTGDVNIFMDRNLGALRTTWANWLSPGANAVNPPVYTDPANTVMGLRYQYGRKDPFSPNPGVVHPNGTGNSVGASIAAPDMFITNWSMPAGTTAWKSAEFGTPKTVFDPCPAGWRLPVGTAWGNLDSNTAHLNGAAFGDFSAWADGARTLQGAVYPMTGVYGVNGPATGTSSTNGGGYWWKADHYEYLSLAEHLVISSYKTVGQIAALAVRCVAEEVPLWGGHADILYFDPNDGNRLKIGQWDDELNKDNYQQRMVFTKFGGVVGFTVEDSEGTSWKNDYIKFDPTGAVTAYGNANSDTQNTLPRVPAYQSNLFSNYGPSVSDPVYHNYTNITQNGRGDICMLAGLTAEQIKGATTPEAFEALLAGRPAEYQGWRLPTARENANFVGSSSGYIDWINWKPGNSNYNYNYTSSTDAGNGTTQFPYYYNNAGNPSISSNAGTAGNPATGRFPVETDAFNAAYSQKLPAAGYRHYGTGAVTDAGTYGVYWSSTPYGSTYGYCLNVFYSRVRPVNGTANSSGNSVRCVHPE